MKRFVNSRILNFSNAIPEMVLTVCRKFIAEGVHVALYSDWKPESVKEYVEILKGYEEDVGFILSESNTVNLEECSHIVLSAGFGVCCQPFETREIDEDSDD